MTEKPRRTGSPAFPGGRHRSKRDYAFFFTSLTLEKVMPSARSRV
ncbi:hypothetical protein ACVMIH_000891 [Bradyrhizobium sp. USDA 4503]